MILIEIIHGQSKMNMLLIMLIGKMKQIELLRDIGEKGGNPLYKIIYNLYIFFI